MSQQSLPIVFLYPKAKDIKQTRLFYYLFSIAFAENKEDINNPTLSRQWVRNRQVLIEDLFYSSFANIILFGRFRFRW